LGESEKKLDESTNKINELNKKMLKSHKDKSYEIAQLQTSIKKLAQASDTNDKANASEIANLNKELDKAEDELDELNKKLAGTHKDKTYEIAKLQHNPEEVLKTKEGNCQESVFLAYLSLKGDST